MEDADNGRAVLNVSLFAPMSRNLTPLLKRSRLELADGMKVRIFGQLDFYAPDRAARPEDGRDRPAVHARRAVAGA